MASSASTSLVFRGWDGACVFSLRTEQLEPNLTLTSLWLSFLISNWWWWQWPYRGVRISWGNSWRGRQRMQALSKYRGSIGCYCWSTCSIPGCPSVCPGLTCHLTGLSSGQRSSLLSGFSKNESFPWGLLVLEGHLGLSLLWGPGTVVDARASPLPCVFGFSFFPLPSLLPQTLPWLPHVFAWPLHLWELLEMDFRSRPWNENRSTSGYLEDDSR